MGAGMTEGDLRRRIVVTPDAEGLAHRAAQTFVGRARDAATAGQFTVALSGGSTPSALFDMLTRPQYRDEAPWDRTQVFFSDERFVPPDSPESNYRMAHETLLSRVPIPDRFVHRVPTVDITPEESAALYEEGVRRVDQVGPAETPSLDLILLGLGPDGHCASLFPDTEALTVQDHLVAANFVPALNSWRVTFTYPLINAARCVMFLVQGAEKAEILARVLSGDDLPAARVRPQGELIWIVDEAAASRLSE